MRPDFPTMWSVPPLCRADPSFTAAHAAAFAQLEADGVTLAGVEVGNEINWASFIGEFAVPSVGQIYNYQDLVSAPEAAAIAAVLRNYVEVVRQVRRVRDTSGLNSRTPLVSAGLADPGLPKAQSANSLDRVAIPDALRYIIEHGLGVFVDAYGVPTYLGVSALSAR